MGTRCRRSCRSKATSSTRERFHPAPAGARTDNGRAAANVWRRLGMDAQRLPPLPRLSRRARRARRVQRQIHVQPDGAPRRILRDLAQSHPPDLPQFLPTGKTLAIHRHPAGPRSGMSGDTRSGRTCSISSRSVRIFSPRSSRDFPVRLASLPCKFFYDERGAELFQQICELPEYYITRTETETSAPTRRRNGRINWRERGADWLRDRRRREDADVARTSARIRSPMSRWIFPSSGSRNRPRSSVAQCPRSISCRCAPITSSRCICRNRSASRITSPSIFPGRPSAIWNRKWRADFLRRVCRLCGKSGGLIIGVDLQKDRAVLEAAYNDSAGVTAEFNLNLLVRANRELGADFDLPLWRHRAIYNRSARRIEMHLISEADADRSRRRRGISFRAGRKDHYRVFLQVHAWKVSRARRFGRFPTRARLD